MLDPKSMDPHLLEGPVAKVALTLRELTIEINQISNWEEEKQGTKEIMDILPLLLPLISLDHWICIFSIFMLIMANNMSPTTWDHLFSTLQSILSTMRIHMTSVSGISPLPRLFTSEEFPPYDNIIIPMRIFSLFKEFKGEIFRMNNQIIIGIPSGEWLRYGEGDMSFRTLWIVAQVKGTGHQMYQVRDTVVTYWVNRWEPPAIGGNPPSLPPSRDLTIFRDFRSCNHH